MSRKLLFFSSLLTVFSCFRNGSLGRSSSERDEYLLRVQAYLLAFVHSTPLNIVSWALLVVGFREECGTLLDFYERFLGMLDNTTTRDRLGKLNQDAYEDDVFLECRELSHEPQRILKRVCFELDSPLREFTFEYGVF